MAVSLKRRPPSAWVRAQTSLAAEGPRCPYADEPVLLGVREHDAAVVEQASRGDENQIREVKLVAEIERDDASVDNEHIDGEDDDEPVVVRPELGDVFSKRVDPWNDGEQAKDSCHQGGGARGRASSASFRWGYQRHPSS